MTAQLVGLIMRVRKRDDLRATIETAYHVLEWRNRLYSVWVVLGLLGAIGML